LIDKPFRGTLVGIILLVGAIWLVPKIFTTYLIVFTIIIVIFCLCFFWLVGMKDEKIRKALEFELEQLDKKKHTIPAGKSKRKLTK